MQPGAFSISLAVRDIDASIAFYGAIGFEVFHRVPGQRWAILRNGTSIIGVFEGMIESNILTFNPGWDQSAQPVEGFTDVRAIQAHLDAAGIALDARTEPEGTGRAHILLRDPDGNVVMFDQHVPAPGAAP